MKMMLHLMDKNGTWTVSPAYDLTFSSGLNGEPATMVMGEGRNPKIDHLLRLAAIGEISPSRALEIVHQVHSAVNQWTEFAQNTGVSKMNIKRIQEAINCVSIKSV